MKRALPAGGLSDLPVDRIRAEAFAAGTVTLGIKELIDLSHGAAFRLLRWDQGLDEVYQIDAPGKSIRIESEGTHWHYHQAIELTIFTQGHGIRFVGDRIQRFEAGTAVMVGSHLPHYWHTAGTNAGLSLQFYFPATHPIWAFKETQTLGPYLDTLSHGIEYSGAAASRLTELMTSLAAADAMSRLGLFLQILDCARSAPSGQYATLSSRPFWLDSDSAQQNAMRGAMHHILTHFREEITMADILRVTRMSKATFSRHFKHHTGQTLQTMVQQVRIEAACRELAETRKPVIDVAYECGFTQISFFNRVFQRARGTTPTAYRHGARRPC